MEAIAHTRQIEPSEVVISHGIARFKRLTASGLSHGYSVDGENMAYSAPGVVDNQDTVTARIKSFYSKLSMDPYKATTLDGGHSCKIRFLDDKNTDARVIPNKLGSYIDADAVITTGKSPLGLKPADCHAVVVAVLDNDEIIAKALIHAGRRQIGAGVPADTIEAILKRYSVAKSQIKLAITPGLRKEHHIIKGIDVERVLEGTKEYWAQYGGPIDPNMTDADWEIDMLPALLDQFRDIPESNIEIDSRDSYQLAKEGVLFSQRYSTERLRDGATNGDGNSIVHARPGRYLVVV